MSEKEKPLPQPPSTPFGRKKKFEQQGDDGQLVADQLAMAMAEGTLDDFIKSEIPDNDNARKLTQMMMGMSGMSGMSGMTGMPEMTPPNNSESDSPAQPPEDLVKAALEGDVQGLVQMLRREHEKNNPPSAAANPAFTAPAPERLDEERGAGPAIEKEIVDALTVIAKENSLSVDWLILRALKIYVEEYKKTGRL